MYGSIDAIASHNMEGQLKIDCVDSTALGAKRTR
jgi:hypothetical protein